MSDQVPSTPPEPTPEPATPPPPPTGETSGAPSKDERTWAMLAHLSGIIFGFLGSLVIWLIQKETMPFVNDQAKEALNWQITLAIGWVVAFVLSFVGVGIVLYPILWVLDLVFCIMGGMKANEGVPYRYPFRIKIVS
jgi:uncharacterized Tic20 family protein